MILNKSTILCLNKICLHYVPHGWSFIFSSSSLELLISHNTTEHRLPQWHLNQPIGVRTTTSNNIVQDLSHIPNLFTYKFKVIYFDLVKFNQVIVKVAKANNIRQLALSSYWSIIINLWDCWIVYYERILIQLGLWQCCF